VLLGRELQTIWTTVLSTHLEAMFEVLRSGWPINGHTPGFSRCEMRVKAHDDAPDRHFKQLTSLNPGISQATQILKKNDVLW